MSRPISGDIRYILSRIRPNAKWGWEGGDPADLSQLNWRDLVQTEPIQAEFDAEQLVIDVEEDTKETNRTAHKNSLLGTVGADVDLLTPPQNDTLTKELLRLANAVDGENKIKPLDEWSSVKDLV